MSTKQRWPLFAACWSVPAAALFIAICSKCNFSNPLTIRMGTEYHSKGDVISGAVALSLVFLFAFAGQLSERRRTRFVACIPLGILFLFLAFLTATSRMPPVLILDP